MMRRALIGITFVLLIILPYTAEAQTPTVELTKTIDGGLTTIDSGAVFTYVLQYRCVGIVANCDNVTVSDVLPPELAGGAGDVVLIGTPHTTGQTYDPATRTATWTFINPLPAGSTGELRMQVRFPPGVTPNGTIAQNQATIDATNTPAFTTPLVPITATATNTLQPSKTIIGGGAVPNQDAVYRVEFCRPSGNSSGQLNMTNITLVDNLPPGAVFVSASGGGVYDGAGHTVTWGPFDYDVTGPRCITQTVTVQFPSPPFNIGDNATNTLTSTGTPVGSATPVTSSTQITHGIVVGQPNADVGKSANTSEGTQNEVIRYRLRARNTGNVPLDDLTIRDAIPVELDVTQILTGGASATVPIAVCYETNLNAACTPLAGSPFTTSTTIPVSSLGLGAGEYLTALVWDYGAAGTIPPGYDDGSAGYDARILDVDRNGQPVPVGVQITNTATLSATQGATNITDSDGHVILVTPPTTRPQVSKNVQSGSPANPTDIITYRVQVGNAGNATNPLIDPVVVDLLDVDVEFVDWAGGGTPAPTLEQLDNYNATGRTLLRWRWARTFNAGENAQLTYRVRVRPGTAAGPNAVQNQAVLINGDTTLPRVVCPNGGADTGDLDGDGDTTEPTCSTNVVNVRVNSQAVIDSVKWVQGDLDTALSRYPDSGFTSPGGTFRYELRLTNTGNVPVNEFVLIDILPYIGDTGVIDTTPRLTEWRPTLETLTNIPSGVIVEYSETSNPCRPEVVPGGPVGCVPPNWSVTPPADLTLVRSLRFSFGTTVLEPEEEFILGWTMRTPTTAQPGEIAWNSFAYAARRVDNGQALLPSEPFKVGVTTLAAAPYGRKALNAVNGSQFEWAVVWVNNTNDFPINLRMVDPIPAGTVYDGGLQCVDNGLSVTSVCQYDAATNRIIWEGMVAPERGATEQNSIHKVVILFRVLSLDPNAAVTNQAEGVLDRNGNGDFSDETAAISQLRTNVIVWSPGSPPGSGGPPIIPSATSDILSRVTILPATGESPLWRVMVWGVAVLMVVFVVGAVLMQRRRGAEKRTG